LLWASGEISELDFIYAAEAGVGLIEMTHSVSESIGFRRAAEVLKERLPKIPIEFMRMTFPYRFI